MSEPESPAGDQAMEPGKVCITNLNPGEVRIEFLNSLLETVIGDLNDRRVISYIRPAIAGPLLDIYRNRAVEWFLANSTAEWMLFIDSDIVWKLSDLYALIDAADASERPVMSGVYLMILPEGLRPGMFFRQTNEETGVTSMTPWPKELPVVDGPLVDCDGVGAGFLLMHRTLLTDMLTKYGAPMPWFANEVIDGVVHGEDFTFCKRVQEMGFRVIANPAVRLDHIKSATFTVETFNDSAVGNNLSTPPIGVDA